MDHEIVAENMARLEALEQERQRLDARFEELDAQERVLRESADKQDEQVADLERRDEVIDGQLTELERRYQGLLDQRTALEEQFNALEESFTALENQRNDLAAERKSCDVLRTSARDDAIRLEAQTVELQAISQELVEERDRLDAEYTRLYAYLNEVAEDDAASEPQAASDSQQEDGADAESLADASANANVPDGETNLPETTAPAAADAATTKPIGAVFAAARRVRDEDSTLGVKPLPPLVGMHSATSAALADPGMDAWLGDAPSVAPTPNAPTLDAAPEDIVAANEDVERDAEEDETPAADVPRSSIIMADVSPGTRASVAAGSIVVNLPHAQGFTLNDAEDDDLDPAPPKSRGWMWAGLGAIPVIVVAGVLLGSSGDAPAAGPASAKDVAAAGVSEPQIVILPPVPPPPSGAEASDDKRATGAARTPVKKEKRRPKRKRTAKSKDKKVNAK